MFANAGRVGLVRHETEGRLPVSLAVAAACSLFPLALCRQPCPPSARGAVRLPSPERCCPEVVDAERPPPAQPPLAISAPAPPPPSVRPRLRSPRERPRAGPASREAPRAGAHTYVSRETRPRPAAPPPRRVFLPPIRPPRPACGPAACSRPPIPPASPAPAPAFTAGFRKSGQKHYALRPLAGE